MHIDSIKPTTQPLIRSIKQTFTTKLGKLKTLVKDVFEREKTQYLVIDGKKIKEKDLPNSVTGPSDLAGITIQKVVLSDEDIRIMEKMSYEEKIQYRSKLLDAGKYKIIDY